MHAVMLSRRITADPPISKRRAKRLLASMLRRAHIQSTGTWTGVENAEVDLIIDCICTPLEERIAALEAKMAQVEVRS